MEDGCSHSFWSNTVQFFACRHGIIKKSHDKRECNTGNYGIYWLKLMSHRGGRIHNQEES